MHHLPKITVVTPSYNQGEFIEKVITLIKAINKYFIINLFKLFLTG